MLPIPKVAGPPSFIRNYTCGPLAHALNTHLGVQSGTGRGHYLRSACIYHALAVRRGKPFPAWAWLYRRGAYAPWLEDFDYDVFVKVSRDIEAFPPEFLEWTEDEFAFIAFDDWSITFEELLKPVPDATPIRIASILDRLRLTKWRDRPGFHYLWGYAAGLNEEGVSNLFGVSCNEAHWGAVSAIQQMLADPGFWIVYLDVNAELLFGGDVDISLFHRAELLHNYEQSPLLRGDAFWRKVLLSVYVNAPAAINAFAGTRKKPYTFSEWPFTISRSLHGARGKKRITEKMQRRQKFSCAEFRLAGMARDGSYRRPPRSRQARPRYQGAQL